MLGCMQERISWWLQPHRVDGCFIKGFHKGKLLAAVGIDPNNAIYLIVYDVVESDVTRLGVGFLSSSRKIW